MCAEAIKFQSKTRKEYPPVPGGVSSMDFYQKKSFYAEYFGDNEELSKAAAKGYVENIKKLREERKNRGRERFQKGLNYINLGIDKAKQSSGYIARKTTWLAIAGASFKGGSDYLQSIMPSVDIPTSLDVIYQGNGGLFLPAYFMGATGLYCLYRTFQDAIDPAIDLIDGR